MTRNPLGGKVMLQKKHVINISIGAILSLGGIVYAAGSTLSQFDTRLNQVESRQAEDRKENREDHKAIMTILLDIKEIIGHKKD